MAGSLTHCPSGEGAQRPAVDAGLDQADLVRQQYGMRAVRQAQLGQHPTDVAACAETVDRADPRHQAARAPRREPGVGGSGPHSEDLAELDGASASVQVQGDRYPEAMQRMIDRLLLIW